LVSLIKSGNTYNAPLKFFLCDTYEDFEELKKDNSIPVGSEIYIIDEKETKILMGEEWLTKSKGGSVKVLSDYEWAHSQGGF
jgi:ABC-type uncharacterized transport system auxiliary subunit